MSNGYILLATIIIVLAIIISFYYYSNKVKKRDAQTIDSDWKNFQNAVRHNRTQALQEHAHKVLWNEHITYSQLEEMFTVVEKLEVNQPELKELRLLIYNKLLDFKKSYS